MNNQENLKADLDKAGNKIKPKKNDMKNQLTVPTGKRREALEKAYEKLVGDNMTA